MFQKIELDMYPSVTVSSFKSILADLGWLEILPKFEIKVLSQPLGTYQSAWCLKNIKQAKEAKTPTFFIVYKWHS